MFGLRLMLAVGCCLLASMASAQITIQAGDVPQTVGDSCRYKYVANSGTVDNGSPGGPHTWTFDTASYVGYVLTTTCVDKATTPFADRFPEANLVTSEPRGQYTLFVYDKLQADGLLECGFGAQFGGGGMVQVNVPFAINVPLPATLGTTWQTDYTVTDTAGDTTHVAAYTRWGTIDAWGTAVTPVGSHACLRENWVVLTITTTYVSGTPIGADTSLTRRYLWAARNVGTVAMTHSMEGDTNPNFTLADDIMVMVQTSSGVAEEGRASVEASRALPGATIVRGVLRLPNLGDLRGASCALLGLDGRKAMDLHQGANDLRALAPGIYFYRLESDNTTLTRKAIKID
jgi:hypothetical protein